MNGEADNSRFVSMHVYMHLAFKELNPTKQASSCILPNNLIALRGPRPIFIKSGWQRSADEASTNFMIEADVTFIQTKMQV